MNKVNLTIYIIVFIVLITTTAYYEYKGKRINGHRFIVWLLWDLSGVRAICSKINPDISECKSKPATFMLWFFGIYLTLYGISSQKYQYELDKLETNANSIITLSTTTSWKAALERIPLIQNRKCSLEPKIFDPITTLKSIFLEGNTNHSIVRLLQGPIIDRKSELNNINLDSVNLNGANLKNANIEGSNFNGALFDGANLSDATFNGCRLQFASFKGAILRRAVFESSYLVGASFENAVCEKTVFKSFDLSNYFNPFDPENYSLLGDQTPLEKEVRYFGVAIIFEVTEALKIYGIAKELSLADTLVASKFDPNKEIENLVREMAPNLFIQTNVTIENRIKEVSDTFTRKLAEGTNYQCEEKRFNETCMRASVIKLSIKNLCENLNKVIRATEFIEKNNTTPSGWRIKTGKEAAIFFGLGLKADDLIIDIDGVKLNNQFFQHSFNSLILQITKLVYKKNFFIRLLRQNSMFIIEYSVLE